MHTIKEQMANLKFYFGLAILLLYGGNKGGKIGGKEGGNYGVNLGGILANIHTNLYTDSGNFKFPHFLQDRFQKRFPFRIYDSCYFQKNWFNREKTYFIPQKNEVT